MRKNRAVLLFILLFLMLAVPLYSEKLPSFPLDKSDVNSFDRAFMQPYNAPLDDAATLVELGMLAAPGAFLLVPGADWFNDGLMYAETGLISYGARYLLKKAASRPRPCMYYDSYPQKLVDDDDWDRSMPSGHTTMCFATAAFVTYMFETRYPDSEWKVPAIISAYGLAAVTGAMRVASGNHFVTDVLAGAALGTVTGFGVPLIHDRAQAAFGKDGVAVSTMVSPFSLGIVINF